MYLTYNFYSVTFLNCLNTRNLLISDNVTVAQLSLDSKVSMNEACDRLVCVLYVSLQTRSWVWVWSRSIWLWMWWSSIIQVWFLGYRLDDIISILKRLLVIRFWATDCKCVSCNLHNFPSLYPPNIENYSWLCYMPCPSHTLWFDPCNIVWWSVQIMESLIMEFSPADC